MRSLFEFRFHTQIAVAIVLLGISSMARAQAGTLDTSYGKAGVFVSSFSNAALGNAAVLQADGKLVVGGEENSGGILLRLTTSGALDSTFGSGGVVDAFPSGGTGHSVVGVALTSSGEILALGTRIFTSGSSIGRFKSNGALDTTFGSGGFAAIPTGSAFFLLLQPNGKILAIGSAITRFNANGTLDTTFGTGGVAPVIAFSASAAKLQSNGSIVVASGAPAPAFQDNGSPGAGSVARYTSTGAVDTTLGIEGQTGSIVLPSAAAILINGKILVAGAIVTGTNPAGSVNSLANGFGVLRFNANGTVDTTFGTSGGAVTPFSGMNYTAAYALAIQSNGDIVAAGEAGNIGMAPSGLTESFGLARYTGAGQLDTTFGNNGTVVTDLGGSNGDASFITALQLQVDGKILAAGTSNGQVAVARYLAQ